MQPAKTNKSKHVSQYEVKTIKSQNISKHGLSHQGPTKHANRRSRDLLGLDVHGAVHRCKVCCRLGSSRQLRRHTWEDFDQKVDQKVGFLLMFMDFNHELLVPKSFGDQSLTTVEGFWSWLCWRVAVTIPRSFQGCNATHDTGADLCLQSSSKLTDPFTQASTEK